MRRKNEKSSFNYGKIPPQDVEVEKRILGYLFNAPKEIKSELFGIITQDVFYKEQHGILYEAMRLLHEDNKLDVINTISKLRTNGKLDEVGGPSYVADIKKYTSNDITIAISHTMIILQKYVQRQIIAISENSMNNAYNEEDVKENINKTIADLSRLLEFVEEDTSVSNAEATEIAMQDIHAKLSQKSKPYYKTGDDFIDNIVQIFPDQLCLLAGKSGSGKTKYVHSIMNGLLEHNNDVDICWYALEDGLNKSIRTFVSMMTYLDGNELQSRGRKLNDDDLQRITTAMNKISKYSIDWKTNLRPVEEIRREFSTFVSTKPKDNLKVLIIDNINKLDEATTVPYGVNRDEHISSQLGKILDDYLNFDKVYILVVHHFSDELMDKNNLKYGYQPREKYILGSSKYRSIATQLVLTHNPGQFSDLVSEYKKYQKLISNIFISECVKNRDANLGIGRYFSHLGYNVFRNFDWKKRNE